MSASKFLLGTRKGLIVYKNVNGQWRYDSHHFSGIPVSIAACDKRDGSWWALQDHGHWGGKIHRSTDQGQTWNELAAPKYPEGELIKEDVNATLKYLWAFSGGGADRPGRIYIGTEPGGLFVSEDNGENFELVRSLWDHPSRMDQWFGGGRDYPGIHSIIVDPRNSDHIQIAISCAGVFDSVDAGQNWTVRNKGMTADFLPDPEAEIGQDPHIIVSAPSNPDVLWQQNHCGIFRSDNGGQLWHNVSEENGPANFGFCIAVHEKDPMTAWVIPGKSDGDRVAYDNMLQVCRTTDGGKSWTSLRDGLPQQGVFDIVYRHALDIQQDELIFGTTTGNLYHSPNAGDRWNCLSNNLPMVYSAQFIND